MNQTLAAIFAETGRGQYIISQALYLASEELRETEPGNAADMRDLRQVYFSYQPPTLAMPNPPKASKGETHD